MKDQRGGPLKRIKPTQQMSDETFMKHLELRHGHELKMEFTLEPDQEKGEDRKMRARKEWVAFHNTLHRIATTQNNHWHGEREDEDGEQ